MQRRMTDFDWFMLLNFALWSMVILFGYRWRRLELVIYLLLVLLQALGMGLLWLLLRRVPIPAAILAAVQVAILLHLLGGTVFVQGTRLYDFNLLPALHPPPWFSQAARYDKLVHAYWAAVGTAGFYQLWERLDMGPPRRPLALAVILLMVMGCSALVEVAEYVGTRLIDLPEVGGYDNNLQDLLANLVGALGATLLALRPGVRRSLVLTAALVLISPPLVRFAVAHPPYRPLTETPAAYGLAYETVQLRSPLDGARLVGWYLPGPTDRADAVVLAHGYLNDRLVHGRGLPLAKALHDAGFAVLLYDSRGQGLSAGGPVTFGVKEAADLRGALAWVRARGAPRAGVLGYSTGAVAALRALDAADAVVADSAWADLGSPWWGKVPPTVLPATGTPLLLIHGGRDRIIPVSQALELAVAAPWADLWIVPAGRHTHSYEADPRAYTARVVSFFTQQWTRPSPRRVHWVLFIVVRLLGRLGDHLAEFAYRFHFDQ